MSAASCFCSIASCPLPMARPGGMRGAIESAALAVWQALACRIHTTSLADVSDPPQISPQRPCAFRRATVQLIFVIFISLGTRRAKCKITVSDGSWLEFASKNCFSKPCSPPRQETQFRFFFNFHDIDMNMQIEFVSICSIYGPLRNRILAHDLCTFMIQGPSCKALFIQNTCIFIRRSV